KELRAKLAWPRAHRAEAGQVAVDTAPTAAPAAAPEPEVKPQADGFDEGEDGDLVDDTPPAASADPPAPSAQPVASAAASVPEKAHKKRASKSVKLTAEKAKQQPGEQGEPARADDAATKADPGPKGDKPPRRKHKAKVAHVQ